MEDDNDMDWVKRARENPVIAAEVLIALSRQPPASVNWPQVPASVPRRRPRSRTITLQGIREAEAERQRTSPEMPQTSGNHQSSRAKPPAAKRSRVDQGPSGGVGGNAGGDSKVMVIVCQATSLRLRIRLPKPVQQPQDQLQQMGAVQNSEAPIPIGHDHTRCRPAVLESPASGSASGSGSGSEGRLK